MSPTTRLLERLSALIHQSVRDDAARYGLQPIHVQVLSYLARANDYSNLPIAIAEYFGITRGTVSQSLNVLERKGLVLRQADPRHGKRIHLTLTAAGAEMLEQAWSQRIETVLASMPLEKVGLEAALHGLLTGLQRLNGQRPFGVCRQCAHFLTEGDAARCGLTDQPLGGAQITKICREWMAPRQGAVATPAGE